MHADQPNNGTAVGSILFMMNNSAILPRMLDGIVQLLVVKLSVAMLVSKENYYYFDDSLHYWITHTSIAKILADVHYDLPCTLCCSELESAAGVHGSLMLISMHAINTMQ